MRAEEIMDIFQRVFRLGKKVAIALQHVDPQRRLDRSMQQHFPWRGCC